MTRGRPSWEPLSSIVPSAARPYPNVTSRSSTAGGADARRQAIFERVDTDEDGVLSQHEFMGAGAQDFSDSDADGDGKVTIWEFYAATRL
jgi:hypothetical protein